MNQRLRKSLLVRSAALIFAWLPTGPLAQNIFDPPVTPPIFLATETTATINIDGILDEPAWKQAEPVTDFLQREPEQRGAPDYPTEVRVLFDHEALYISAICYQPRAATRVQNLRRDFVFDENDLFGIALDGFLDRRNTLVFQTSPFGSQRDMEVIDGTESNLNWDARWNVRTKINDNAWIAEIAIPWRNLRYPDGADRIGVIFARNIRSINQQLSIPAVPRAYSVQRMAYEGELHGITPPSPHMNIHFNPYILGRRDDSSVTGDERGRDVGGEIKWVITPSTALDVTLNTDFAQVDSDRQVINLDRFSVFFPERRQFFLENANIFNASVTEWIRPFFSRRIGLDDNGNPIPLDGGIRLTSRSARQQAGVLAMRQPSQGDTPTSDFAVARYSRNVAGQSRLGGMVTYRNDGPGLTPSTATTDNSNATYTVDGLWRPNQSFGMQAMLSLSDDDQTGHGSGAQLWAFYQSNRIYLSTLQYYNKDYNPGIGLELLDTNYVMHNFTSSFDLRSARLPDSIRSYSPGAAAFVFRDSDDGDLLFGFAPIRPIRLRFQNGGLVDFVVEPNWQRLDNSFSPAGIDIAPGKYDYTRYRARARTDQSSQLSADISVETGDYFDGQLTSYSLSSRYTPVPNIELSADVQLNQLRNLGISNSDENTQLYRLTARVAPNPRLHFSVFYQHDTLSDRSAWNLRLSWEYRPLSYLYLVYNESEVDGLQPTDRLSQDQIILKWTYLFEM